MLSSEIIRKMLAENVGEHQLSASQDPAKPPPEQGSGEGGYLGLVPGVVSR